jgi:hypothetical protein
MESFFSFNAPTPHWKELKSSLIRENFSQITPQSNGSLGHYDLVYVPVNDQGEFLTLAKDFYFFFTRPELSQWVSRPYKIQEIGNVGETERAPLNFQRFMLGEFLEQVRSQEIPVPIAQNPVQIWKGEDSSKLYFENIIYSPLKDNHTGQLMMTSPEDAKALYAISPKDHKRYGLEIVFHCIGQRELPLDLEERAAFLKDKIEELSFYSTRVPMKKGSASYYIVIINLENDLEESAFIRPYRAFDQHTDFLFVKSNLQVLDGDLELVPYSPHNIDGIMGPIIDWQRNRHSMAQRNSEDLRY